MCDGAISRRSFVGAMGAVGLGNALVRASDTPEGRESQALASDHKTVAWAADRVFDGREVLADHAVVTSEGLVVEVTPRHRVPPTTPVRHEPGATILPGLIDTHVHHMQWEAPLFLAYGVTTVRDVGNDLDWILAQRERAREALGPTILCVGPLLDGPVPIHPFVSRASADAEAAVVAVRETADAGVDGIKLYCGLSPEWLPAMVSEAHAHGLLASMHCQGTGVVAAGEAGVDEFFHLDGILTDIWPDRPPGWLDVWGDQGFRAALDAQNRVADRIAQMGMAANPTLAYWHSQWRTRAVDHSAEVDEPGVPPEMIAWQGKATPEPALADRWYRALEAAQDFTRMLFERGVPILAGSDVPCGAQTPGLSLWRELWLLAQAGVPALSVLRAATSGLGDFLGQPMLGRLRTGSAADLVVVRGDPTQSVPERPDIAAVVRAGVAYQQADLLSEAQEMARSVTQDPWSAQFRAHAGEAGSNP